MNIDERLEELAGEPFSQCEMERALAQALLRARQALKQAHRGQFIVKQPWAWAAHRKAVKAGEACTVCKALADTELEEAMKP